MNLEELFNDIESISSEFSFRHLLEIRDFAKKVEDLRFWLDNELSSISRNTEEEQIIEIFSNLKKRITELNKEYEKIKPVIENTKKIMKILSAFHQTNNYYDTGVSDYLEWLESLEKTMIDLNLFVKIFLNND